MSKKPISILGINHGGHDTSACLMINGKLIAACEEERFNKKKHTREFPIHAINECLKQAKVSIEKVDEITLSYDPKLLKIENFEKLIYPTRNRFKINDLQKLRNLRKQDFDLESFV